jgi:chromosome segregation ATPase
MNTVESLETSRIIQAEITNLQARLIKVQHDLIEEQKGFTELREDLQQIANKVVPYVESITTKSHAVELAEMQLQLPLDREVHMELIHESAVNALAELQRESPLERERKARILKNERNFKQLNLSLESHVQEIMNLQGSLIKVQDNLIDAQRDKFYLSWETHCIEDQQTRFVNFMHKARVNQLETQITLLHKLTSPLYTPPVPVCKEMYYW